MLFTQLIYLAPLAVGVFAAPTPVSGTKRSAAVDADNIWTRKAGVDADNIWTRDAEVDADNVWTKRVDADNIWTREAEVDADNVWTREAEVDADNIWTRNAEVDSDNIWIGPVVPDGKHTVIEHKEKHRFIINETVIHHAKTRPRLT